MSRLVCLLGHDFDRGQTKLTWRWGDLPATVRVECARCGALSPGWILDTPAPKPVRSAKTIDVVFTVTNNATEQFQRLTADLAAIPPADDWRGNRKIQ